MPGYLGPGGGELPRTKPSSVEGKKECILSLGAGVTVIVLGRKRGEFCLCGDFGWNHMIFLFFTDSGLVCEKALEMVCGNLQCENSENTHTDNQQGHL